MKTLWAPWRMAYIQGPRQTAGCVLCAPRRFRRDAANLILHRGTHGFVIMNRFPYNNGHLMVAPYAHVGNLEALSPDCALELIALANLAVRALRAESKPEGFNLGINLGKASGAGIEAHLHLHVVPRWNGDTNFMTLFSETRVIPEHLRATYRKLRARVRLLLAGPNTAGARQPTRRIARSGGKRHPATTRRPKARP